MAGLALYSFFPRQARTRVHVHARIEEKTGFDKAKISERKAVGGMAVFGRPKKYKTEAAFRKAVSGYFDGITVMAEMEIFGQVVKRLCYTEPPSVSALCLQLGINRRTWANYSDPEKNPEFADVCEEVKLRIEAYLENELISRTKGSVQGIIFDLQNNHDWKQKSEVELGEKTRAATAEGLSLSEKIALIKEAAAKIESEKADGG